MPVAFVLINTESLWWMAVGKDYSFIQDDSGARDPKMAGIP